MEDTKITKKVPPQNLEAESNLLASILIDNSSLDRALNIKVNSEDFYDERHRNIYKAIIELRKVNKPVDLITLTEMLKTLNILDKSGGAEYISSLIDMIPTSANTEYYAEIVKSKSMLRQLIFVSSDIIWKYGNNRQTIGS